VMTSGIIWWNHDYLREIAQAARNGLHVKQDVARRFDATVLADAMRAVTARRPLLSLPMKRPAET